MASDASAQQLSNLFDAGSLHEKARKLAALGQYVAAEATYKKAVEKRQQAAGAEDAAAALTMTDLAGMYCTIKRYAEADELLGKALAIVEKAYYADHAHVATVLMQSVRSLVGQGKYAEAEPVAKRVTEINGKTLSGEHRQTLDAIRVLAQIYMQIEKPGDAEALLSKAMKNVDTPLGPAGYFQYDLARAFQAQGKKDEADKAYNLAASWLEQRVRYNILADCLTDYAQLLKETGRASESAAQESRAKIFRGFGPDREEQASVLPSTLLRA